MRAVAQRYARALVEVALKENQVDVVRKELTAFTQVVADSSALRSVLANPAVGRDKKQAILKKLAEQIGAGKTVRNFLMILAENRRAQLLPLIREAFDEQMNLKQGIAQAEVVSAKELSAQEKSTLTAAVSKMTGKRVEASYKQDAGLIGGTIVRVGSTVYNGSVRDQLKRMKEKLAAD